VGGFLLLLLLLDRVLSRLSEAERARGTDATRGGDARVVVRQRGERRGEDGEESKTQDVPGYHRQPMRRRLFFTASRRAALLGVVSSILDL
jgi:hypothetical protein